MTVSVTLLVSLESIREKLEGGDRRRMKDALRSLARLGPKGGHAAVVAVSRCLEDESWGADDLETTGVVSFAAIEVRENAVQVLSQVAEKGDQRVCAVLRSRMKEDNQKVRV